MVDILSIDIFYNGQCSIKLSSSPLYHIYCYLLCHETYQQQHLFVCLYQIHKIDATAAAAGIFDVALGLYIWWMDGGFIEWVPCCHLLLNTGSGSEPAMTRGQRGLQQVYATTSRIINLVIIQATWSYIDRLLC